MANSSMPTPSQLFRMFENGEITRSQFQAAMRIHALDILEEAEECHQNPLEAWVETQRCRMHAAFFARKFGEKFLRDLLLAMSEIPDFPPAQLLWNADHWDVPLYCYFRLNRDPVFRLKAINLNNGVVSVDILFAPSKSEPKRNERLQLRWDNQSTPSRLIVVHRELRD